MRIILKLKSGWIASKVKALYIAHCSYIYRFCYNTYMEPERSIK